MTREELLEFLDKRGACTPAVLWLQAQEAEATLLELWERLVKMRRSPEEEKAERELRAKDPSWKSDPETHTGWAWASWIASSVGVRCGNGFNSGRRAVHPGPNADRVDPQEVLRGLETEWRALLNPARQVKPLVEAHLFTWDGFDQRAPSVYAFHDVTLQRDLGAFKKGDTFALASLNYKDGTLELFEGPTDECPCYHGAHPFPVEP